MKTEREIIDESQDEWEDQDYWHHREMDLTLAFSVGLAAGRGVPLATLDLDEVMALAKAVNVAELRVTEPWEAGEQYALAAAIKTLGGRRA